MPDDEGLRERLEALADALEAEGRSLPPGGGAVADTTACERIMTAHRPRDALTADGTEPRPAHRQDETEAGRG